MLFSLEVQVQKQLVLDVGTLSKHAAYWLDDVDEPGHAAILAAGVR